MNRTATAAAVLAGVALVAVAVSLLSDDPPESSTPTAPTAPSSTVAGSEPGLRRCTADDLRAGVAGIETTDGAQTTEIVVTNVSASHCGIPTDAVGTATEVTITGDLRVVHTDVPLEDLSYSGLRPLPFEPGVGSSESVVFRLFSGSPGPGPGQHTETTEFRLDFGEGDVLVVPLAPGTVGASTGWLEPPDFPVETSIGPIPPADVPLCGSATPGVHSALDIGLGSTLAEFEAAYPAASPLIDDDAPAGEVRDSGLASSSGNHLVFRFRDGVVERIAAGEVETDVARCD